MTNSHPMPLSSTLLMPVWLLWVIVMCCCSTLHGAVISLGEELPKNIVGRLSEYSLDEIAQETCDGVRYEAAEEYGKFEAYYKTAEKSRQGKALEALISYNHNTQSKSTKLIPTKMLGAPHDKADLIEIDSKGKVLNRIQVKRTLQASDLTDSRYRGMQFITTKDRLDEISEIVTKGRQKAGIRGIILGGDAGLFDQAITSGRLRLAVANKPPPSIFEIENLARRDALKKWSAAKELLSESSSRSGLLGLDKFNAKTISSKSVSEIASLARETHPTLKTRVQSGLLTKKGQILVPFAEGLLVFAVEGGSAYYDYRRGKINSADFEQRLTKAAVKGSTVAGCTAVTIALGASPVGFTVLAVGIGASVLTDFAVDQYERNRDRCLLAKGDLDAFGFVDDGKGSLSPDSWSDDGKNIFDPISWDSKRPSAFRR